MTGTGIISLQNDRICAIVMVGICIIERFECCLKRKLEENMPQIVSIGNADYESIRKENCFYVDKTSFIRNWWDKKDVATLIMRPRRFGKTLNMSMLNCFFSNKYAGRSELFEGLEIWQEEKYRKLQGTYPVIFISFASVKADNFDHARKQMNAQICRIYEENSFLLKGSLLSGNEKQQFCSVRLDMDEALGSMALNELCCYLYRFYKKKVIILLDEYDTPMQEAYLYGYWDEFVSYVRSLFNATFKTNLYMERALLTGITRVSKESIFSDLNNLNVITAVSEEYQSDFGFTEQEVFRELDARGMGEQKELVKKWYNGFIFGSVKDIYNPWSITNFLDKRQLRPYWAMTSSNRLVNQLLQQASGNVKRMLEDLMENRPVVVHFDEQIVFEQLNRDENAIWSLLLASGYLKAEQVEYRGELLEPWYHLSITNLETRSMFSNMFRGWFDAGAENYNAFVRALLEGSIKEMNIYMNEVALAVFSNFDTGKHVSEKAQPERFYHGFVLGLLVELRERYVLKSNKESGYGRYDVMLVPRTTADDAIVIEFKVHDSKEEHTLEDTVAEALQQIEEKRYDAELIEAGIEEKRIRHYGFAFEGKKVLIG